MNSTLKAVQTLTKNFLVLLVAFGFAVMPFGPDLISVPTAEAASDTIFSDGFETDDFTEWSNNESPWTTIAANGANGSTHRAEVSDTSGEKELRKDISTTGYENITISYYLQTADYESEDTVKIQYSTDGGSTWTTQKTLDEANLNNQTTWLQNTLIFSSDADNKSDFQFRFLADLDSAADTFGLDNVELTGDPISSVVERVDGSGDSDDATFTSIQEAINDSDTDPSDIIRLLQDVTTSEQVTIDKAIILDGDGYTIDADFTKTDNSNNSAIGVIDSDNVTIQDLIIDGTNGTDLHGINVYESTGVVVDTVTAMNFRSGIGVNSSEVTARNITTSGNIWHGINVDKRTSMPASLTIEETSMHDENSPTPPSDFVDGTHVAHIFVDDATEGTVINDVDNQYVTAEVDFREGRADVYTLKQEESQPEGDNTIRICKLVVDNEGNIFDGANTDSEFEITIDNDDNYSTTTTFTTPLDLSDNLFNEDEEGDEPKDDVQCVEINNLPDGDYYYGKESIVPEDDWQEPQYHDGQGGTPEDLGDFVSYDQEGGNDADGHIRFTDGSADERTLTIKNTYKEQAPEPGPASLSVCKILLDGNGNPIAGEEGTTFELPSIEGEAPDNNHDDHDFGGAEFDTPLIHNADLLEDKGFNDSVNDAECETIDGLEYGNYFYGEEEFPEGDSDDYLTPQYSDFFHSPGNDTPEDISTTTDAFGDYSDEIFTEEDVENRDKDRDGHLVLNENRPDRTIVVVNQLKGDVDGRQCAPGEQTVDEVIEEETNQGTEKDGDSVSGDRSDVSRVLGAPDGEFYSLGEEGVLTVKFDEYIVATSGPDISVYEVTDNPDTYPEETALVEVSQDGSTWASVGTASNKASGGINSFDIESTGFDYVQYVRLTDTTDFDDHQGNADGFDVDAIVGSHGECEEPEPVEKITLVAEKVVCEAEEDLPNWGNGADIDADTAQTYVDEHDGCELHREWQFQWVDGEIKNQQGDDTYIGEKDGWNTFYSGTTTINLDELEENDISIREVLPEGYIPFTFLTNDKENSDNESAEFYCSTDGNNYDNLEWASDLADGQTVNCVGFNTLQEDTSVQPLACEAGDLYHLKTEVEEGSELFSIDSVSGSQTSLGLYDGDFNTLAAHPDGDLYALAGGQDPEKELVILNSNGSTTPVTDVTGIEGKVESMGFAPDGTLYVGDVDNDKFYEVDTSTGTTTELSNVGDNPDINGGDLVINEYGDLVYVEYIGNVYLFTDGSWSQLRVNDGRDDKWKLNGDQQTSLAYDDGKYYSYNRASDEFETFILGEPEPIGDVEASSNATPEVYVLDETPSDDIQYGDGTSCVPELVEQPETTDVTMCKYDDSDNSEYGLYGWTLALLGDEVGSTTVSPDGNIATIEDVPAGNYVIEGTGTYVYRPGGNLADSYYSERNPSDPGYAGLQDQPWRPVSASGYLALQINGDNGTSWNGSFNPQHVYYAGTSTSATQNFDFKITDDNYSDNSGNLTATIYEGYVDQTGETGCATFEDVPHGDYIIAEQLQMDWENESGLGEVQVDDDNNHFNIFNSEDRDDESTGTISGSKWVSGENDGGPGLGWEISLYPEEGEVFSATSSATTTTTGEGGSYTFEDVPYGTYLVCEENREGYDQYFPSSGTSDTTSCGEGMFGHVVTVDDDDQNPNEKWFGNSPEEPPFEPTILSGPGGGALGGSDGGDDGDDNGQQVLGAQDDGQMLGDFDLGNCEDPYLTDYMHPRADNDPMQVLKLQVFLNGWIDADIEMSGQYDTATTEAVKDFQEMYAADILAPWGETEGTGYAYITTIHKINALLCDALAGKELPPLIPGTHMLNMQFGK